MRAHRRAKAKYQRDYRHKLKRYGARTMGEVAARELEARAISEREASRLAIPARPEPPRDPIEPPAVSQAAPEAPAAAPRAAEPAAPPRPLLALLTGAKIAPPD